MKTYFVALRTKQGEVDCVINAESTYSAHNQALNIYPGAIVEFVDELDE